MIQIHGEKNNNAMLCFFAFFSLTIKIIGMVKNVSCASFSEVFYKMTTTAPWGILL